MRGGAAESYSARVIDTSGSGILFDCDGDLRVGQRVEATILWPAKLDGKAHKSLANTQIQEHNHT